MRLSWSSTFSVTKFDVYRSSKRPSGEYTAITCRKLDEPFSTATPWRRTSSGSLVSACLTRLLTFSAALSTSVPMSKVTWICTTPFDDEVELM
jgi:hypothetical protein